MRCVQTGRAAALAAAGHPHATAGGGMVGRLRKQAIPHLIIGGVMLAAAAAQLAAMLAGDAALVALTIAVVAMVVTLVAAIVTRARRGSTAARRFLIGALAGIAWIMWTTLAGFSWSAVAVLMVIGYGAALPYWRAHRIPNITKPAEPAEPAEPATVRRWRETLGSEGDLAGTYLTDPQHTPGCGYERWVVQLRPGRHSFSTLQQRLDLIASAFQTDPGDVVLERYRDPKTGKLDASRALLTLTHQSPVQESVPFDGPRVRWNGRTCVIELGPYADGNGEAVWRLFSPGSMWGGIVIGATGSGKSRLLEILGCSATSTGLVSLVYADPQRGNSSPALADHAHWTARGVDECIEMLRALRRIMAVRELVNAAAGRSGFTPTPETPGILVILDECHMVLGDPTLPKGVREEAVWIAEQISRVGRKLGIALVLASQEGDLSTFGGSNALRNNVRAGNTIVLRTLNKQIRGLLELPFNPATLPEGGGYGYTMASPEIGGRTAPFRGRYLEELSDDEYAEVRDHGAQPRRGSNYWWLAQYPSAELDSYSARAAGEAYERRHETATLERDRAAEALAAFVAGTLPIEELLNETRSRTAPAGPQIGARASGGAITAGVDTSRYGKIIPLPVYRRDQANQEPQPQPRRRVRDLVLELVSRGVTAPRDLAEEIGCTRQAVHNALNALEQEGLVYAERFGEWRLTRRRPA